MAKRSILDILINVVRKGDGDQAVIKGLAQVQNAIGQAGMVFGALAGAAYATDRVLKATVGTYVDYADRVRDVMDVTGLHAEKASALIQVMDDLGVEQDVLTKGMKTLADQGIEPTIENLAAMSDEYLTLEPGVARVNFLMDHFGSKSGPAMALAMEQGGEKLRSMNGAVRENLILTDQQIVSAQETANAFGDVKEEWEGLLISLGADWAPKIVTGLHNVTTSVVGLGSGLDSLKEKYHSALVKIAQESGSLEEFQSKAADLSGWLMSEGGLYGALIQLEGAGEGYGANWDKFYEDVKNGAIETVPAVEELSGSVTDLSVNLGTLVYQEWLADSASRQLAAGLRGDLSDALESSGEKMAQLQGEEEALMEQVRTLLEDGIIEGEAEQFDILGESLQENRDAQRELADATQETINKLLYQSVASHLTADAALDYARSLKLISEKDYALQKGIDLLTEKYDTNKDGIVSAEEGASKYTQEVEKLRNMILQLPAETVVDVIVNYISNGTPPPSTPEGQQQTSFVTAYAAAGTTVSAAQPSMTGAPRSVGGGGGVTFNGPITIQMSAAASWGDFLQTIIEEAG